MGGQERKQRAKKEEYKKGIRNSSVEIQAPGAIFRDKGARSLRGYFKHPLVLAPASGSTLNALGKFRDGDGVFALKTRLHVQDRKGEKISMIR